MDPEPGRCRRTDGKKWRCSKNVVPDHKYCERHMHRGCQRSRKHVEASQTSAAFDDKASTISSSENPKNSITNYSNLTTVRSQMKTESLSNTSTSPSTASGNVDIENTGTTRSTSGNAKHKSTATTMNTSATIGHETTCIMAMASEVNESTATGTTIIDNSKNGNIDINRQNIGGGDSHCIISAGNKNIINRSNSRRNIKSVRSNISQGLDFSPKSVLQVQRCSASPLYKCDLELEPGRCRRTDGKKWRCRRDVVTDQKYCGMHMHRGAKRHARASQPAIFPKATLEVSMCTYPHPTMTLSNKADCVKLNTNFSISISESPCVITKDDASATSNGSDATISDSTFHIKNFS